MRKVIAILFSVLFLNGVAQAGMGISVMGGQLSTSGTEKEKSGEKGPESNHHDISEIFYGASVYFETETANGIVFGVDYVPLSLELGSGKRTDTTSDSNEDTSDSGTYSASADVEDLITLYTNVPVGDNGAYGLFGIHMAEITTSESLPNGTYGNEDVYGAQIGFGIKRDKLKYEFSYSDFEDISLNSSSGSSKVEADADALTFKVSYGF